MKKYEKLCTENSQWDKDFLQFKIKTLKDRLWLIDRVQHKLAFCSGNVWGLRGYLFVWILFI